MGRRRSSSEYKSMLATVRTFARGFDASHGYDARHVGAWAPGKKASLTRYFNEIHRLTFRPYTVYEPRQKKNLKAVQNFSQHAPHYPKIKVAFVPGIVKPEITVKKSGQVIARDKIHGVTKRTVLFNKIALITDTDVEIRRAIDADLESKAFRIMAGNFEIGNVYGRSVLPDTLNRLMARYDNTDKNNFYGNWLHGIIGYDFDDRNKFMDFNRELLKAKSDIKSERRSIRRKAQYEKYKIKKAALEAQFEARYQREKARKLARQKK